MEGTRLTSGIPICSRMSRSRRSSIASTTTSAKRTGGEPSDRLRPEAGPNSEVRFEIPEKHPDAIVVNIGCGLDTIFSYIDNGRCRFVNIDFPEVIQFRQKLFDSNDRITDIVMDAIFGMDGPRRIPGGGPRVPDELRRLDVLPAPQMKKLIDEIGKHFPGAVFCFGYENARMLARSNRAARRLGTTAF